MATSGLYSRTYINNFTVLINYLLAYWMQLSEHSTHENDTVFIWQSGDIIK